MNDQSIAGTHDQGDGAMTTRSRTTSQDVRAVISFLQRISTRRATLTGAYGAAVGATVGVLLSLVGETAVGLALRSLSLALAGAAVGAAVGYIYIKVSATSWAHFVEQRAPECANVVVTAHEIMLREARLARGASAPETTQVSEGASPRSGASPRVAALVYQEAARVLGTLQPAGLLPSRAAFAAVAVSAAIVALVVARDTTPVRTVLQSARTVVSPNVARIDGVRIMIAPPAYTRLPARQLQDSSRVDVLAGSELTLQVQAHADSLLVQTVAGSERIASSARNQFVVRLPAREDGFIVLQPLMNGGTDGARRLIGITVVPDAPPRVRITQPARDTRLSDAGATLAVSVAADDDIGLASLRLRYTKVSGSGERFSFDDGEVPLDLTRASPTEWTARAQWSLAPLALEPGDLVVYRAVAVDTRPGAPAQESDALIAEMVAVGGDAAAGFDIDPEFERYAVSQAMVVLKTERLIAAMGGMSRDSISAASQELAVEQRKVRAEFVFMMGGELADEHGHDGSLDDLGEEAEAEAEDDILAGRLENQGRVALMRAVRAMSRATSALNAVEVASALTSEKAALAQIELAFSRSRILLRALSVREALDLSRRLSGDLTDARSDRRAQVSAEPDPRVIALQRELSRIAGIAGAPRMDAADASELAAIADELLQQSPMSDSLQAVASTVSNAAGAAANGQFTDARTSLERAALSLAQLLQRELPVASQAAPRLEQQQLDGVLTDALRAAVGGPRGSR